MINSGMRQGCIMSPWLFNVYMDGEEGSEISGVEMLRCIGKEV